jgi:hypothetical protein
VAGQARAATVGERMGDPLAREVQPGAVEARRAEDRIVDEALGAGGEREQPPRRAPPAQDAARGKGARRAVHDAKRAPIAATYRRGVGVMLINRRGVGVMLINGLVWVGRRIDNRDEAWQMPQGGLDKGEDSRGPSRPGRRSTAGRATSSRAGDDRPAGRRLSPRFPAAAARGSRDASSRRRSMRSIAAGKRWRPLAIEHGRNLHLTVRPPARCAGAAALHRPHGHGVRRRSPVPGARWLEPGVLAAPASPT